MTWRKVNDREMIEKLHRKACRFLPTWGSWRFSSISENGERVAVIFRNTDKEKAFGTLWFQNGKPFSFTYSQKIGAKG